MNEELKIMMDKLVNSLYYYYYLLFNDVISIETIQLQ
jgi:hypothetical protein